MSNAPENWLLTKLSEAERRPFLQKLESIVLPIHRVLYRPEQEPFYVHFLTSGIASIVTNMEDGQVSEGGLIGCEGMPESLHLLGPGLIRTSCFMRVAGTGLRMRFKVFQEHMRQVPELRDSVLAFVQYQSLIVCQIAACNRLHELEARLACWLLMVNDRTDEQELPFSHQVLAEMLGSRRSTITVVAAKLQSKRIIEYGRGTVRILDRYKLESVACECYPITQALLSRLHEYQKQPILNARLR